jgi:hypothetical protein
MLLRYLPATLGDSYQNQVRASSPMPATSCPSFGKPSYAHASLSSRKRWVLTVEARFTEP